MDAGPGGSIRGQCTVIITASVVHIPKQELGVESLLAKPIGEGNAIQGFILGRAAKLQRNRERAALAEFSEEIFEPLELFSTFLRDTDNRLNAFLPAAIQKEPFLW